jgi:hypothetical protein
MVSALHAITGGVTVITVTVAGAEGLLIHSPFLQVAVIEMVADGLSTTLTPVAPFDQVTTPPSQPLAVRVTLSPAQIVPLLTEIVGEDGIVTVTVLAAEASLTHSPILQVAV